MSETVRGELKWFNAEKGFGFISREDGQADVFVHATALKKTGREIDDFLAGDRLSFTIEFKNGKTYADNIEKV